MPAFPSDFTSMDSLNTFLLRYPDLPSSHRTVLYMAHLGYTLATLASLPVGVALPLMEAISQCQDAPHSGWPKGAYDLLGRQDLSNQVQWLSSSSKKHRRSKVRCLRHSLRKQSF